LERLEVQGSSGSERPQRDGPLLVVRSTSVSGPYERARNYTEAGASVARPPIRVDQSRVAPMVPLASWISAISLLNGASARPPEPARNERVKTPASAIDLHNVAGLDPLEPHRKSTSSKSQDEGGLTVVNTHALGHTHMRR